jgi:hypothetical protein
MATVREHLVKMHTQAAEHHLNKAKLHKAVSSRFRKMHKAQMEDDGDGMDQFDGIADAYDAMAGEEVGMGEYHADCAKALMQSAKAAGMGASDTDLDRLIPDAISGVLPERGTAVPRYGAPEIAKTSGVPLVFEKLVAIE